MNFSVKIINHSSLATSALSICLMFCVTALSYKDFSLLLELFIEDLKLVLLYWSLMLLRSLLN